ncbi:MAG: AbgT family transporter [Chloroflexi bacterium]|nr:AbgT family transporter [Chloroflexota bacterium]
MDDKAGARISKKAFLQSALILLLLMVVAGVLTRVLPAGSFERNIVEGRTVIVPGSYQTISAQNYPVWRWFTAPFEVLWGQDALVIITIILFILLVSSSFAVLDKSGILKAALAKIVKRFGAKKYLLLLVVSFFFMLLGAFLGLFEEIVPLVPLMIALSYSLGWDALVGLGMSILATNMGFSAAISNPFTIGVAQKLAGLPLFSGGLFRIPIFLAVYALLAWFLFSYAKRIDRNPETSLIFKEDQANRKRYASLDLDTMASGGGKLGKASLVFAGFMAAIVVVLLASPFVSFLSDYSLPLVGILFFAGGLAAGFVSGAKGKLIGTALVEGVTGLAPGIPLLLMAASIKQIVTSGQVMDTVLNSAAGILTGATPLAAVLFIFGLALLMEFFIGSAGAKAVLMMPILLPLADLLGVTRQLTVLAYCFGDGFSNLAYPTNAVLLITLGLATLSYGKWIKWTAKLWLLVLPIVFFFLWLGTLIGYGPF